MSLSIDYLPTADLIPYALNSRTHTDTQVAQIAASIHEFGFTNPILIDEKATVIAGHGRLLAAQRLDLPEVPTILLSGLTQAQKKAYVIADNKLALNAGWDADLLTAELESLKEMDFDISITGFDELPDLDDDVDYSLLDGEDMDVSDGVKKAIMVDFELEHYEEAYELFKWWRSQDAYVGYMILDHLRKERKKHEAN